MGLTKFFKIGKISHNVRLYLTYCCIHRKKGINLNVLISAHLKSLKFLNNNGYEVVKLLPNVSYT